MNEPDCPRNFRALVPADTPNGLLLEAPGESFRRVTPGQPGLEGRSSVRRLKGRAPAVDLDADLPLLACSGQVVLRHPKGSTYRCFLPDLTGFAVLRRAGP